MKLSSIVLAVAAQPEGSTRCGDPELRGSDAADHFGEEDERADTVVVPVSLQGSHFGTVLAQRPSINPFTPRDHAVFERLALGLSLALHASTHQEQEVWLARCRERQGIANMLHDDVAPILFSARCALESLLDRADNDPAGELLRYAHEMLVRGEVAVRGAVSSSDDSAGNVIFELAELLRALEDRFRVPISFDVDEKGKEGIRLGEDASRALLRATKEGVSNAVKHAAPALITVSVEVHRGWLNLKVADNGSGRQAQSPGGHGLRSVRKELWRLGGELNLATGGVSGATLSIRLPVAGES
jgi:signal transduction histidine kinase